MNLHDLIQKEIRKIKHDKVTLVFCRGCRKLRSKTMFACGYCLACREVE